MRLLYWKLLSIVICGTSDPVQAFMDGFPVTLNTPPAPRCHWWDA
jgi:hypothetical protein